MVFKNSQELVTEIKEVTDRINSWRIDEKQFTFFGASASYVAEKIDALIIGVKHLKEYLKFLEKKFARE